MKTQNKIVKESDLHLMWALMLFRNDNLMTENSNHIYVEFPGIPTVDGGPDFRFARIFIDGTLHVGSVELHLYQTGWEEHDHKNNTDYSNVVLHVCLFRTKKTETNSIPLLILETYLKESLVETLNRILKQYPQEPSINSGIGRILDSCGDIRIRKKIDHIKKLLENIDPNEVLYRELLSACGYKHNKAQFYELARLIPYSSIKDLPSEEIERLLLCSAGLSPAITSLKKMSKNIWRYHGVRPVNYPETRIKAASNLIATLGSNMRDYFSSLVNSINPQKQCLEIAKLIKEHSFNMIGDQRALEIVQNVIFPFYIAENELQHEFEQAKHLYDFLINSVSPRDNFATRYMRHTIFGSNVEKSKKTIINLRRNWGLLQLYSNLTTQHAPFNDTIKTLRGAYVK